MDSNFEDVRDKRQQEAATRADSDTPGDRGPAAYEKDGQKEKNESPRGDKDRKDDTDSGDNGEEDEPKKNSRWPIVLLVVVVLLAIAGGVTYWFLTRDLESTDDRYTEGIAIDIAPKF